MLRVAGSIMTGIIVTPLTVHYIKSKIFDNVLMCKLLNYWIWRAVSQKQLLGVVWTRKQMILWRLR